MILENLLKIYNQNRFWGVRGAKPPGRYRIFHWESEKIDNFGGNLNIFIKKLAYFE